MSFRDSWHRALVYFGLAEEYHDEDYEEDYPPEEEIEERYRERPNVRRLSLLRSAARTSMTSSLTRVAAPKRAAGARATTVLRPRGR